MKSLTTKFLIIFLSAEVLFFSCKNEKAEIIGTWRIFSDFRKDFKYWVLTFDESGKIELVNDSFFKETGKYEVRKGKIKITLANKKEFVIDILKSNRDFLTFSGGTVYEKVEGEKFKTIENYTLVGVDTGVLFDGTQYHIAMHLYLDKRGHLAIRRMTELMDEKDVPHIYSEHPEATPLLIFIGKGVPLRKVNEIYIRLELNFSPSLLFVLDKKHDEWYNILPKPIEVWQEDIENYVAADKHPPFSPRIMNSYNRKSDFLKTNPKVIKIKSRTDLRFLDNFDIERTYLVEIDSGLDITAYVELMVKIQRIKDSKVIDIRTDII